MSICFIYFTKTIIHKDEYEHFTMVKLFTFEWIYSFPSNCTPDTLSYSEYCMSEKTIYRCVATNNGRISISGSNQYGRPMSFVIKSNIPKTRDCLRSDGGFSVKEIAGYVTYI